MGNCFSASSLAGAKADLDYAQMQYDQYMRALNYTISNEVRSRAAEWRAELDRARKAYAEAEEKERKKRRSRDNNDVPRF